MGGAYVLCELDGAVMDRPVAAFRVVPYFPRHAIPLPDGFEDITSSRLRDLLTDHSAGDDEEHSDSDDAADPDDREADD